MLMNSIKHNLGKLLNQLIKLVAEVKEQWDDSPKIVAPGWKTVPKNPVELWRAG